MACCDVEEILNIDIKNKNIGNINILSVFCSEKFHIKLGFLFAEILYKLCINFYNLQHIFTDYKFCAKNT